MIDEPAEVHCAVVDIATRSKLSCLSWNKYTKHCIASSDYEGIVTVWDVATRQVPPVLICCFVPLNRFYILKVLVMLVPQLMTIVLTFFLRVLENMRSMKNELGVWTFRALNLRCWYLAGMTARYLKLTCALAFYNEILI